MGTFITGLSTIDNPKELRRLENLEKFDKKSYWYRAQYQNRVQDKNFFFKYHIAGLYFFNLIGRLTAIHKAKVYIDDRRIDKLIFSGGILFADTIYVPKEKFDVNFFTLASLGVQEKGA